MLKALKEFAAVPAERSGAKTLVYCGLVLLAWQFVVVGLHYCQAVR